MRNKKGFSKAFAVILCAAASHALSAGASAQKEKQPADSALHIRWVFDAGG